MGVAGLASFLKENAQKAGAQVNLGDVARQSGKRLLLACDGYALLFHLMRQAVPPEKAEVDFLQGGDFPALCNVITSFVQTLQHAGVDLWCVFDPAPLSTSDRRKVPVWRDRFLETLNTVEKLIAISRYVWLRCYLFLLQPSSWNLPMLPFRY